MILTLDSRMYAHVTLHPSLESANIHVAHDPRLVEIIDRARAVRLVAGGAALYRVRTYGEREIVVTYNADLDRREAAAALDGELHATATTRAGFDALEAMREYLSRR